MKKITYKGQSKILIALCNLVNELVDAVGSAGNGDMKKSVYDTNGNGIVDNAEKVNNHTVNANVPENAVFTDTTYTFSQSGSQLTLTDDDGNAQSVNVPSTDTNTTYTMSLDGSKLTLTDSDGNAQNVTLPSGGSGGGTGMDWTLLKTVTGTEKISLADVDFDKLYVSVSTQDADNVNLKFHTTILKNDITEDSVVNLLTGGYSNNNYGYNVSVNLSTSAISLRFCYIDKVNKKDSAVMSVYYGKKSSNELKITSDTWTPTNEYINGERLYKKYYEKTFGGTVFSVGWNILETFANLGIKGAYNTYINVDGIMCSGGEKDYSSFPLSIRGGDASFSMAFNFTRSALCIVVGPYGVSINKIMLTITTVESNIVTS